MQFQINQAFVDPAQIHKAYISSAKTVSTLILKNNKEKVCFFLYGQTDNVNAIVKIIITSKEETVLHPIDACKHRRRGTKKATNRFPAP